MPAPIVYQKDAALVEGIRGAGSAFAQALAQRNLEQKELQKQEKERDRYKQSGGVLNEILSSLPQDATPEQYQNALTLAIQKGVPLELVKQASDLYKPILQERAKQAGAQNFFNSIFGNQAGGVPAMSPMTSGPMGQTSLPMDQGAPAYELPNAQIAPPMLPGMEPPAQQPQPQQRGFDITTTSMDNLMKLMASPYKQHQNLAEAEIRRREIEDKKFIEERKYNTKGAEAAQQDANTLRKSIRGKEGALQLARQAIETGETGPLSWANISQRLGYPELMNQAGTELTQAGKEFFFGNMQKVSAKAQNQWLEQRITKLAAEVGDPRISALTKQTMLEGELDLDKAYLEAYDRLAKEDMQKYKYVKNDIEERAYNESQAQAEKILQKVAFRTRALYEEEKGADWLMKNAMKKVPKGTVLTPKMAKVLASKYEGDFKKAVENAKKLGYMIPSRSEVEEWQ